MLMRGSSLDNSGRMPHRSRLALGKLRFHSKKLRDPWPLEVGRPWSAIGAKRPSPKGRRSKGVINRLATWLERDICHLLIHRNNARPLRCYQYRFRKALLQVAEIPAKAVRMVRGLCIGVEMV
jgi:hypothetical protein